MKHGKRYNNNFKLVNNDTMYDLKEAVDILKKASSPKFDETIDIAVNLGVDTRNADQMVRGTVSMPNGTGKNVKVIVITKDDEKESEAVEIGGDEISSV